MPIKMIIADDDLELCKYIVELIDWESYDIEIVGVAHDGYDLVKLCKEKSANLCIVDIMMPQMSGLDAMNLIRSFMRGTKFIICSSSQDFEHARLAILRGASAYLLKPINDGLMNRTIIETVEEIRREQEEARILNFARSRINAEKMQIFNALLKKWIQNSYGDEDIEFSLQALNLHEKGAYLLLLIDHPEQVLTASGSVGLEDRICALQRAVQKKMETKREAFWSLLSLRQSLGIVKYDPNEMDAPTLEARIHSINDLSEGRFHIVGKTVSSLKDEFYSAYEELEQLMNTELKVSPVIQAIERMVKLEYMNPELSLCTVAKRRHVNPQYLSRLFKHKTGLGFSEFLIQTRVEKAKQLILTTNIPIQEIASLVGYSSHYYFSSAFKKMTGFPPIKYRLNQDSLSRSETNGGENRENQHELRL